MKSAILRLSEVYRRVVEVSLNYARIARAVQATSLVASNDLRRGLPLKTVKPTTKHSQSRAAILQAAGILPNSGRRKTNNPRITEQDYAAVPPPLNLKVQPTGNCLIWLWRLNDDGYGKGSFPGGEQLAHRQAFTQSRERHPRESVLHLCHRPFCIQPSHLYDGSAMDNSDDRSFRVSHNLDVGLFDKKSEIVQAIARYEWPSPQQHPNRPLLLTPIEHDCEFIIPAMDRHICPTCGRDELSDDDTVYFEGAAQPANSDPNVSHISKRSRSFKDLPEGLSASTTGTVEYSVPKTRAERRRRERMARKSPYRSKPVLLGSARVDPKPGESVNFTKNLEHLPITGPGFILLAATPIKTEATSQGGDN